MVDDTARCPACGSTLTPGAACAVCARVGPGAAGRIPPGETVALGPGGVLAGLDTTIGPVPRVLLRPVDGGGPPPAPARPDGDGDAGGDGRAGRFELLGEIARGGMGAVLKGRDADLGRELAVKVLLERHGADPGSLRRFVEEAQIAGQLHHPGIVPVYELGAMADRRPYIAMKLVEGRTLAAVLADRADVAVDRPGLLAIFLDVAQTMAYAHARGVIHCDLKPANIMVGAFGEVQVMDWGLARVVAPSGVALPPGRRDDLDHPPGPAPGPGAAGAGGAAEPGLVLGTPAYMAPEQARGEVDRLDARADVFALGSLLCEILTGRPAYTGWSVAEVIRRAARAELAEAVEALRRAEADPELVALARAALAPDPAGRPPDAGAVVDRLTAYLAGVQEKLHAAERARVAASARAEAEARRRRATVALAASLLAMAGLVGGGYAWVEARRAERRDATGRAVDRALVDAADRRGRSRAVPGGDPGQLELALAEARRAASLLAQGEADPERGGRVRATLLSLGRELGEARARAESAERDRVLVARLRDVHAGFGVHSDRARMDREYAAAFRDAGVDVDALAPAEVARRIEARPVGAELVQALDQWIFCRQNLPPAARRVDPGGVDRLVAAADAADPDPWRRELRDACRRGDRAALRRIAEALDLDRVPKESASRLAYQLHYEANDPAAAARVLRAVAVRYRDDFWVAYDLGNALLAAGPAEVDEALRYATAAAALQPRSRYATDLLGRALGRKGRTDELAAVSADLVRRAPDEPAAHFAAANSLRASGRFDEAIAEYRRSTELNPRYAPGFLEWGGVHWDLGRFRDAIDPWRAYVRLAPGDRRMRNNLAAALVESGRWAEAAEEARAAIRLDRRDRRAHELLGAALLPLQDWDGSIVASREALAIQPGLIPRRNLALGLLGRGDFAAAAAEFRLARGLATAPGQAADLDRRAEAADRLADRAARLPAVLRGDDRPRDAAERVDFAEAAARRGLHASAARLYAEAFADPAYVAPPEVADHYNAACSAALAGTGADRGDAAPDAAARAAFRRQALAWLRVALLDRTRALDADAARSREETLRLLQHWAGDADLAGVRDPAALGRLPADERAAWGAFWGDVAALRARAGAGAGPAPRPGGQAP